MKAREVRLVFVAEDANNNPRKGRSQGEESHSQAARWVMPCGLQDQGLSPAGQALASFAQTPREHGETVPYCAPMPHDAPCFWPDHFEAPFYSTFLQHPAIPNRGTRFWLVATPAPKTANWHAQRSQKSIPLKAVWKDKPLLFLGLQILSDGEAWELSLTVTRRSKGPGKMQKVTVTSPLLCYVESWVEKLMRISELTQYIFRQLLQDVRMCSVWSSKIHMVADCHLQDGNWRAKSRDSSARQGRCCQWSNWKLLDLWHIHSLPKHQSRSAPWGGKPGSKHERFRLAGPWLWYGANGFFRLTLRWHHGDTCMTLNICEHPMNIRDPAVNRLDFGGGE